VAGAGADVDDPVGVRHHRLMMRDDDDRLAGVDEPAEQLLDVGEVEAGGRLVEDVGVALLGYVRGELETLPLAAGGAGDCVPVLVAMLIVPDGSAKLLDADQVARGIAEGAIADPVRLVGRLLDDLGVAGLQPLEGAVDVGGCQVDAGEGSLGHHLGDGAALVVGDAGGGG
jgi:hypothetical protein